MLKSTENVKLIAFFQTHEEFFSLPKRYNQKDNGLFRWNQISANFSRINKFNFYQKSIKAALK